jgi:hypothetical protein
MVDTDSSRWYELKVMKTNRPSTLAMVMSMHMPQLRGRSGVDD